MSELGEQTVVSWRPRPQPQRVVRVELEGEVGREASEDVAGVLSRLFDAGERRVVIDWSEVSHFDYRGVRPMMAVVERFRERGGDVRLAGLSPYLFAIFQSAGADGVFDCFASAEDAVGSYERAADVLVG